MVQNRSTIKYDNLSMKLCNETIHKGDGFIPVSSWCGSFNNCAITLSTRLVWWCAVAEELGRMSDEPMIYRRIPSSFANPTTGLGCREDLCLHAPSLISQRRAQFFFFWVRAQNLLITANVQSRHWETEWRSYWASLHVFPYGPWCCPNPLCYLTGRPWRRAQYFFFKKNSL